MFMTVILSVGFGSFGFSIAFFVGLLLPIPEVLAVGSFRGVGDLFEKSLAFLMQNFVPWVLLNVVGAAVIAAIFAIFAAAPVFLGASAAAGGAGVFLMSPNESIGPALISAGFLLGVLGVCLVFIVALHPFMLLRSQAFVARGDAPHRTRLFKYRSGAIS